MRVDQQPCWILHRRPWRESSLLLEVFSRDHGRLGLVAKGARAARSPLRGLTEPFIPLQCSWTKRSEMGTLTGLEATAAGVSLQGQALWCGLYLNELMLTLFGREDPLPELFEIYSARLPDLSHALDQADALRQIELAMLSTLGVLPDLSRSVDDEAILAEGLYHVEVESGLVKASAPGPDVIHGQSALWLLGQGSANLGPETVGRSRREARLLTRRLIDHQLAGRILKTRELFRKRHVQNQAHQPDGNQ